MDRVDVLIIGGGPAGYTAALYAARAGLAALVLEAQAAGGQMALTGQVDNYPGFEEGVDGLKLGERMRSGAERFGARTRFCTVSSVSLDGAVKQARAGEETFEAPALVAATGAAHRHLGVPGEEALTGRGVSYCAACDGMFFKGKTVVVVGGGNSAASDALLLSRLCGRVFIVHRRAQLRADAVYRDQLERAENVAFVWDSAVEAIRGEDLVTGVQIREVRTGRTREIAAQGVFISIGLTPRSELFRDILTLDEAGYIVADESTQTNRPGVFAAGDVRAKPVRQIVTAVADGAAAAHFAQAYLARGDGSTH